MHVAHELQIFISCIYFLSVSLSIDEFSVWKMIKKSIVNLVCFLSLRQMKTIFSLNTDTVLASIITSIQCWSAKYKYTQNCICFLSVANNITKFTHFSSLPLLFTKDVMCHRQHRILQVFAISGNSLPFVWCTASAYSLSDIKQNKQLPNNYDQNKEERTNVKATISAIVSASCVSASNAK